MIQFGKSLQYRPHRTGDHYMVACRQSISPRKILDQPVMIDGRTFWARGISRQAQHLGNEKPTLPGERLWLRVEEIKKEAPHGATRDNRQGRDEAPHADRRPAESGG